MEFRLMTFNLRYENDVDGQFSWKNRRDLAVELILDHAPAIVCTQEGLEPMLRFIGDRLGGYSMIGSGRNVDGTGEFSAILVDDSRFSILDSGQFWISETPDVPGSLGWGAGLPRICTWCVVKARGGEELGVFNVHLDNRSVEARVRGVDLLLERMAECRVPRVLCGDFNARPNSAEIRHVSREVEGTIRLVNCYDETSAASPLPAGTFHGFSDRVRPGAIDYIFHTADIRLNSLSVDARKRDGIWPSDHYPLIADLSV